MGLSLDVEVILKQDGSFLPETMTIEGRATKQQAEELLEEITDALGITREDIVWIRKN